MKNLNRQIASIIDELPAKRKQIFTLSREQGLTHKEIAGQLNISVKTVENQINLALKLIKSRLGNEIFVAFPFSFFVRGIAFPFPLCRIHTK
jgi:RNA polymerase sigma-70 factor, ECF subfamily